MSRKISGIDGREHVWNLTGYIVKENDIRPRSAYHLRCRNILRKMFPVCPICEEVTLPGSGNLKLDFYLPDFRLAVEVQGEQHYKQVGKFHANKQDFIAGRRRDADKRRWCELNNVRLVELRFDETDEQWASQITNG